MSDAKGNDAKDISGGHVTRNRTAWICAGLALTLVFAMSGAPVRAQSEKRTVFNENDFHWQGNLKAGQTLEVINRNGEIEANGGSDSSARVEGLRKGGDGDGELFFELVEYSDGVTICAVYAKD